ncbi:MAG: AAA family ATPase [Chlorobi bacterium]|nr:AAA family ATPase [Chlorobiota bacterium]
MKIVGITGTLGAGKGTGTIVEYLVKEKGFKHFSVRDYLIREINKRGMTVNRDSMTMVANDMRAKNNPAFIIEELYREAVKSGKNSIIESIRTPGEIEFLRKQGNFILLAVDAEARLRYDRISLRASETDKIDFRTFLANEKREMTSFDINKQNLSRCIDMADIVLKNNGSIEELISQIPDFQD